VARREVDLADVAQLGETREPGVAFADGGPDLLVREAAADDGRRHLKARRIREHRGFAQHAARLWHRELLEGRQLLLGVTVEVLGLQLAASG
jgi:hypothetical protein